MLGLLLASLALAALTYAILLFRAAIARQQLIPRGEPILLGAVTNFLDTLGVGSFAPTMAWMRVREMVPDRLIPLTMLAGYLVLDALVLNTDRHHENWGVLRRVDAQAGTTHEIAQRALEPLHFVRSRMARSSSSTCLSFGRPTCALTSMRSSSASTRHAWPKSSTTFARGARSA